MWYWIQVAGHEVQCEKINGHAGWFEVQRVMCSTNQGSNWRRLGFNPPVPLSIPLWPPTPQPLSSCCVTVADPSSSFFHNSNPATNNWIMWFLSMSKQLNTRETIITQDVHTIKCEFLRTLIGIYSKCGTKMSEIVLFGIIQSYCLPFLTYYAESYNLKQRNGCWRFMLAIHAGGSLLSKSRQEDIFSSTRSSINQILVFTSVLPLEYIIDQRRLNFIANIQNIENEMMIWISNIWSNSYRDIFVKYDANLKCSKSRIRFIVWDSFSRPKTV